MSNLVVKMMIEGAQQSVSVSSIGSGRAAIKGGARGGERGTHSYMVSSHSEHDNMHEQSWQAESDPAQKTVQGKLDYPYKAVGTAGASN